MTIPLVLLSVAAVFAGWAGEHYGILNYLSQELPLPKEAAIAGGLSEEALKGLSIAVGVVGIFVAWMFYGRESSIPASLARNFGFLYRFSLHKWYFDEAYDALFCPFVIHDCPFVLARTRQGSY